jgi:uncharacterized membrane protein
MFAAWGAGFPLPMVGLIASVIYYYINKKTSNFAAFNSYQALLTHIPISIVNAVAVVWGIVLFAGHEHPFMRHYAAFCIFGVLWNVLYMVFSIVACVKARKGRFFYFWVFGRIAFARYFLSPSSAAKNPRDERNLPPEGL